MNRMQKGKDFERRCKKILENHFEYVEFIGNKRKVFDFFCYLNNKKFSVETKYSSGTSFSIIPKQLNADLILFSFGRDMFILNKYSKKNLNLLLEKNEKNN